MTDEPSDHPIIETKGLVKRYGDLTAVDHVSLNIPQGAFFGIIGPNGAGKTTLLELIEGIREPDEGTATIAGLPTWPRNLAVLPKIGVQLQASAFFEHLTVGETLRVVADLYGAPDSRVSAMLDRVALSDKSTSRIEHLSGGQKQRLAIAAALVHEPDVVFLDEPTAALDPQARRNLWELLTQINEDGHTIVLTTHYMDEAELLCDQIAIIDHGKILTVDEPANLTRELSSSTRITLPEAAITLAQAQAITTVERVSVHRSEIIIHTNNPTATLSSLANIVSLEGIKVTGANLEDVFLNLTGREYRA